LLVAGLEKNIANCVFARLERGACHVNFRFSLEEGVRNGRHHTCTVSVTTVRSCSTSVGHGAKKTAGVGYDFVARFAFDVTYETYAASILFVLVEIEPLACR